MKFIELKCNNCGADLKLELENMQTFCQYCGSKLLIDMDNLSEVLKEKEKTKQVIGKEEHITKRKEMDYNYKMKRKEMDHDSFKQFMKYGFIVMGLIFLFGFGSFLIDYLVYIFIGLGIVLGLIVAYVVYQKILKKR